MKDMYKIHFKSKFEKVLFYILVGILVTLLAFYIGIYAMADPEALKMQGIALLVTIACVVFGPVTVFETWLLVGVIKRGAEWYNVLLLIVIFLYINTALDRYGLLGAWIMFRK